ncbi:MAG: tRNA preQ1(34) S-adenosylmethionine ribosyltransferase-isomerase QueA [Candidatus Eremiobacteraeota bacterium]|nr:tRNA preQ1(34) S-adenosylmethionine ribosyltransferase-isomerase QueA [Candidatus Eremiobacteraeota bacterium]
MASERPPAERLVSSYRYDLPHHLIAQTHAHPRDASRLMVVRSDTVEHARFTELPEYLRPGDVIVLNETRVIAARIFGTVRGAERPLEVLLLRPSASARYDPAASRWIALAKPGRKARAGTQVDFGELGNALVTSVDAREGTREIELRLRVPFEEFLESCGRLPLPPYIHSETEEAQSDYQTVFARTPGSVAAPTAALHFTTPLLARLEAAHEICKLSLDVGLGTFRPIKAASLDDHHMHAEAFTIPAETVAFVERARAEGRRIIACGTTVVRALEGSVARHGRLVPGPDVTSLFITPGFRFRVVDGLITNFHLPESSLLVLVSAFAGRERVLKAYRTAVELEYRFFSFGDAMLVFRE